MLASLIGAVTLAQLVPTGALPNTRPATAVHAVSDAEILGAINARDANLIEACTMARDKASSTEVRALAAQLLESHQESLTRGGELAKELQLSRELPADSAMARTQLESMDQLALLSGAAFDRTFVEYVRDAHEAEVAKVTRVAVPSARHPTIKAFVGGRLSALRAHLAMATTWLAEQGG